MKIIKKIFESFDANKKEYNKIEQLTGKVLELEIQMRELKDEDFIYKTEEFKTRIQNGETEDDLLVEAFALAREACLRVSGMFPFEVQIMGAISIHLGNIAEMKTGEGKTLTTVMPAYLNALSGLGVHIVTVNEYLVVRDATDNGKIFEFLGISCGINTRDLSSDEKKAVYNCDILYSTNSELGFDYLRDNMVFRKEYKSQRELNYAIIDEVDSILIDESRTPLIISGGQQQSASLYELTDRFVKTINEEDFEYDEKTKAVFLGDSGVLKAQSFFKVDNLFDLPHSNLVHFIHQALKANYSLKDDVDYVVVDGEIQIVDQFTGRVLKGRAFSDGLHQAIEAKEGVEIKEETKTMATITYQNYFRMYKKLSGMTGTAKTEEEEFRDLYNMYVVEIPTNKDIERIDAQDLIYATQEDKFNAIVKEVKRRNETGQPILIGTISIEISEHIATLLRKNNIEFEILNAKNHAREAEIIAKAGQIGSITIATNMAGRGTDIKLGVGVNELGGLCVIGTERHESRRIDNQLRGRSGRQGDNGYSQFFISIDDELMRRFGGESFKKLITNTLEPGEPLQHKMLSKRIEGAQKQVEGSNFDVRKQLLQYDDVIRQQREIVYEMRDDVLNKIEVHESIIKYITRYIERTIEDHKTGNTIKTEDLEKLTSYINTQLLPENPICIEFNDYNSFKENLLTEIINFYEQKKQSYPEEVFDDFELVISLRIIDQKWVNHLDDMTHLKEGIHLRSYAQENPLRAYTQEGFETFDIMLDSLEEEITLLALRSKITVNIENEEKTRGPLKDNTDSSKTNKVIETKKEKIGRNDICPCGSGKKYKNCHGR